MTYPRPSPPPSSLPAGGQPLQPCSGLGDSASERLGCSGDQVGVSSALVFSQGSPLHFAPCLPASWESSCLRGAGSGGHFTSLQRCDGAGVLPIVPGVLWEDFCGAQGFGRVETGAGPLNPQRIPQESSFQDGNTGLPPGCYAPWRLGSFHRPEGCLFPPPYPPTRSEVAAVCLAGQGFSVPCPPLWSGSGSLDFHEGHQRTVPSCQGQGYPPEGLPRRLACTGLLPGAVLTPLSAGPAPVPQLGFLSQRGEIRPHTLAAVRVPGHDLRHPAMVGVSRPSSYRAPAVPPVFLASQGPGNSTGVSVAPGSDGILCSSGSPGPASQAQVSAPLQRPLVSGPPTLGSPHPTGRVVSGVHQPVGQDRVALSGGSYYDSSPPGTPVHRRLGSGVGSTCGIPHSFRALAGEHDVLSHQPSGTGGCLPGSQAVSPLSGRQESPPSHGQHDGVVLHQQARGSPLSDTVTQNGGASTVVRQSVHSLVSPVCSGQVEHSSRPPQSATHGPAVGMDSSACSAQASLVNVVHTTHRPLCHSLQPSPATVCVPSSRPSSLGSGRTVNTLVKSPVLCLPPDSHHRESSQKGKRRKGHPHSSGPSLASPGLVSRASPSLSCSTHQPSAGPSVSSSAQVRGSARQPRGATPSRLASVRDSLSSLGASPSVLRLVEHAHRPGTQGVYSAHWDGWVRWCSDHSVPPHNPSSCDLANFLAFLSCVKGLSASSIKVHWSAVCTTIRQMGGPTFSDDPLLRDLVRGAALAEAKSPRRIPSWDLFLVLSALRLPPYEPLKQSSLKHLTLKTAFLVSLASGRRCSEVHALSGLPGDVAFEPDGSMSLRFLPDFLAKNQLPGSPSPVISIRSLSSILAPDDEDLFLCPVRALRAYRKRTKSFRSKQRRLLLSWNENYKDDIRRSTISRWLREVITAAYARPGSELAVFSPRPHEIRAWASSLAFASNVSLSSLMEAAYWRSPGTFIHFYLRDVSRLREDGSRGIASAVVAQQTISASCAPPPSSSSRH